MHPVDLKKEMLDVGRRSLVGVIAGGVWFFWAVVTAYPVGLPTLVALITVASLLLAGCAGCILWGMKLLPNQPRLSGWRVNWGFVATLFVEGAGVGIAVIAAQKLRRLDLLPDWIGLVIGLHFFLLARVFRAPYYNLTAAAMTIWCVVSLALFSGRALTIAVGLGNGAVLWTTAGWRLTRILVGAYRVSRPDIS